MRTTKKDFIFFESECRRYVEKLGLKEWSLHFCHEEVDGSYARTMMSSRGMVSTIQFGKYWDDMRPKTEYELSRLAFHEVSHLLMNPLIEEAQERYTTEHTLESLEHTIIRRLENMVEEIK